MKIEPVRENPAPYVLQNGDQITVGVTHQIKVGGEDSWIKYEVVHNINGTQPADVAAQRLVEHVDAQVLKSVHHVVTTLRSTT